MKLMEEEDEVLAFRVAVIVDASSVFTCHVDNSLCYAVVVLMEVLCSVVVMLITVCVMLSSC